MRAGTTGALLVIVLMCTTGLAAAAEFVAADADAQNAIGVTTAKPDTMDGTLSLRFPARVTIPNEQLRIVNALQPGILEALLVGEGESVEKGQPLARVRSPALIEMQADYLEALAQLALAQSDLSRDRSLFDKGIIAKKRLTETQTRWREAKVAADQSRAALEIAGLSENDLAALRLDQRFILTLNIRSPLTGIVLQQLAKTGQQLESADPIYTVGWLNPLWLEIHAPREQATLFQPGDPVQVCDLGLEGELIAIGRRVHEADQGVLLRARIEQGTEQLLPGQFVEAQLRTHNGGDNLYRVPRTAVIRSEQQAYVFVLGDGGFEVLPVAVINEETKHIVVRADLTKDAELAVTGTANLKAAWLGMGGGE